MNKLTATDKQKFRSAIASAGVCCETGESGTLDDLLESFRENAVNTGGELLKCRLGVLEQVHTMAQDPDWSLPRLDRKRITATFRYLYSAPRLTISPIESSLLGAAAIDLMQSDCRAELSSFEEFCDLRQKAGDDPSFAVRTRADWLRFKRDALKRDNGGRFFGMRRSRLSRSILNR